MAKSIRSKNKRANRSALRKTLCEPLIAKRLEKQSAALKKMVAEKKGGSITKLKAVFKRAAPKQNDVEEEEEEDEEEEEEEGGDEGEEMETDELASASASVTAAQSSKEKGQERVKKIMGRKPRNNPTKELVWFK